MDYQHVDMGGLLGKYLSGRDNNDLNAYQATRQKHFAAFIRSGERGDSIENFEYQNKYDPPITPKGVKQAQTTGEFL